MSEPEVFRFIDDHACPDWDFLVIGHGCISELECCTCQLISKPAYDELKNENERLKEGIKLLPNETAIVTKEWLNNFYSLKEQVRKLNND